MMKPKDSERHSIEVALCIDVELTVDKQAWRKQFCEQKYNDVDVIVAKQFQMVKQLWSQVAANRLDGG